MLEDCDWLTFCSRARTCRLPGSHVPLELTPATNPSRRVCSSTSACCEEYRISELVIRI